MKSPLLALLLLAALSDEQLRDIATAQKKAKRCHRLPEVCDRQPAVEGRCWNCGKLVVEP